MMRACIRWFFLIGFCAIGVILLTWSVQDADFSVPAQSVASEIYETKAVLLLPMGILFFAVGALFFICLPDLGQIDSEGPE